MTRFIAQFRFRCLLEFSIYFIVLIGMMLACISIITALVTVGPILFEDPVNKFVPLAYVSGVFFAQFYIVYKIIVENEPRKITNWLLRKDAESIK